MQKKATLRNLDSICFQTIKQDISHERTFFTGPSKVGKIYAICFMSAGIRSGAEQSKPKKRVLHES